MRCLYDAHHTNILFVILYAENSLIKINNLLICNINTIYFVIY